MEHEPDQRSPLAQAAEWTSQVTTVAVEMVLPALGGRWLDRWLGTGIVFLILGAVLGLTAGMWHLLRMTATAQKSTNSDHQPPDADRQ